MGLDDMKPTNPQVMELAWQIYAGRTLTIGVRDLAPDLVETLRAHLQASISLAIVTLDSVKAEPLTNDNPGGGSWQLRYSAEEGFVVWRD